MIKESIMRLAEALRVRDILLAMLIGFLFALVISAPLMALWINLTFIFVRFLALYIILMALTITGFFALWIQFTYQALIEKYKEHSNDLLVLRKLELMLVTPLAFIISMVLLFTQLSELL